VWWLSIVSNLTAHLARLACSSPLHIIINGPSCPTEHSPQQRRQRRSCIGERTSGRICYRSGTRSRNRDWLFFFEATARPVECD
jgi:hypothetical protein